jgi:hypothetical protein
VSLTESLRESEEICKMLRKFEEKRNHDNFFIMKYGVLY